MSWEEFYESEVKPIRDRLDREQEDREARERTREKERQRNLPAKLFLVTVAAFLAVSLLNSFLPMSGDQVLELFGLLWVISVIGTCSS